MTLDGSDWAKYTPLSGQRLEGGEQCHMGLNCCVASGPRGLFTFPLTTVMSGKQGLQVNFYAAGTYSAQTPGKQKAELIQETDYPVNGKINIKVQLTKPEDMAIQLRIPEWSAQSSVSVNGQAVNSINPGKNIQVKRLWKSGDVIELSFDMRGRVIKMGDKAQNVAIMRGPVLLSRDARMPEPSLESVITPVTDKNGYLELEPVATRNPEMWMAFKASFMPESYAEGGSKPIPVMLCDYASAGNSKEGHPHFKVWLPQLLDPRN